MFGNNITAAIRTAAAAAAAFLIFALVDAFGIFGISIDLGPDFEGALTLALFGVLTGLYNLGVNLLTEHVHPWFGVLLGVNKTPEYESH